MVIDNRHASDELNMKHREGESMCCTPELNVTMCVNLLLKK